MSGRIIPTIFGKGQGFPGIELPPSSWLCRFALRTVLALLGMSFS